MKKLVQPLQLVLEKAGPLPEGTSRTWKGRIFIKSGSKWLEKAITYRNEFKKLELEFEVPTDLRQMDRAQNQAYVDYVRARYDSVLIKARIDAISKALVKREKELGGNEDDMGQDLVLINLRHNLDLHREAIGNRHGE
jgi:hypothetical protein